MFTDAEAERYRADFHRVREIVSAASGVDDAPTTQRPLAESDALLALVADDRVALARYQEALLATLSFGSEPTVSVLAANPAVALYAGHVRTFEPHALEVGADMALEWCAREIPEGAMEAAVFRRPGAPLAIVNLPVPAPGPGQVLLRSIAVGLCGTDAHAFTGHFPLPTPIVLGHEMVGVIEAIGPGVEALRAGDRVGVRWIQRTCGTCPACARGAETRCPEPTSWIENGGGLSELVVVEASGCTKIPDTLASELASPLFCAGHVAMSALRRARPERGERVAVLGFGGLGHLAVQIARAEGHEVVAVTSSEEKARDARSLGAGEALVANGNPGEALASIGCADVIVATTSSMADVGAAVAGLRDGGRLVVVGLGEGSLAIDPAELVQREAALLGSVQGPVAELEQVLDLAARGLVVPRVETFPLHLLNRALGRLMSGRVRYRSVIQVG